MKTTIYLATAEGLVVVTSSGEEWQAQRRLEGIQLQCVAVALSPSPAVHCGSFGQGIFTSRDGGAIWTQSPSLASSCVTAITVAEDGTLYAGTEPSSLYQSKDGGETWTQLGSLVALPSASSWSFPPRPDTHHVQGILSTPITSNRILVAVEAGALVSSEDGGTTWQDRVRGGPVDTHTLAISQVDRQRIYSAAGDGFFESIDGGKIWKTFNEGLKQTYCWSVAVAPGDADVILLSASKHAHTAHSQQSAESFVYRRVGNGPWYLAMEGLTTLPQARIPVIAAGTLQRETFFLATDGVIYRSEDLGTTWKQLHLRWNDQEPARRHSLSMAILQEEG